MQPASRAKPDVYVFNTQVPASIGSRAVRRPPYVAITDVTPRQYDRMADGYDHRPDRWMPIAAAKHAWNRRVFQRAAWTVGWSSWVRDSLVDEYAVEPERAVVIPPGVDTTRWTPGGDRREDRVRYLFVGGDFERKGGAALLRAFAKLPADQAELTLVTKSPVAPAPSVRVVDDLGPNDPRLIELYRSSDVFVLPSRSETFGIAAVEAIASGLPVVATDVGGLPDIVVDGETGFTVPPGDVDALAAQLIQLHDSAALRRRLGEAAHRRAIERFDARTNASRLVDLVRQCLGDQA
jgi:glycosyltransferase involved in cell wall biosynthesis